jgi:L-2,4-diaminobutyrate decarboxylase
MENSLHTAFDAENFRRLGHQLIDKLADHLRTSALGEKDKVLDWLPPEAQLAYWEQDWREAPRGDPIAFFDEVLSRSTLVHHPRYLGHQISPSAPLAALAGLLSDLLNNGMGVYEMGSASTAIERVVARATAKALGFGAEADGVLTSGGTLANVTALLAARAARTDVWRKGHVRPLALMVSAEAHYCVDRAARIMGWGDQGIIKIPVDDQFRMRVDLLEPYWRHAQDQGIEVLAAVGSACTTSAGAFDDLEAIAAFCRRRDLWFHVDGAHGAPLALSPRYRHLVKGIEQADSLSMDFHKMLLTPAITTALIFRDGRRSFGTFAQEAQYLFAGGADPEWYNLARRTFECTKLMMSLKVYSLLRTYGWALFTQYVERVVELARVFANRVAAREHFELAVPPSCNILCFRYVPPGLSAAEVDRLNESVRQSLLEHGRFYLVQTRIRDRLYLRCTLANPFTEERHLDELLDEVARLAKQTMPAGKD